MVKETHFRTRYSFVQCFFPPNATTCPCGLRGPPSWAWQECNWLLRLGRPWGAVTLSQWCVSGDIGGCSARRALKPKFSVSIVFFPNATTCPCRLRGPPSWAWQECNWRLRLGRPWGAVRLSWWCVSGDIGGCSARRAFKPKFYQPTQTMEIAGILPFKENSHGRTGNRTRDLVISSQRLWPLDHEAGQFCAM